MIEKIALSSIATMAMGELGTTTYPTLSTLSISCPSELTVMEPSPVFKTRELGRYIIQNENCCFLLVLILLLF